MFPNAWLGKAKPSRRKAPRRVALDSPPQSLGEDVQAEDEPRKRLRLTRSQAKRRCLTRSWEAVEMDLDHARDPAPHPGDAGGGGAIR